MNRVEVAEYVVYGQLLQGGDLEALISSYVDLVSRQPLTPDEERELRSLLQRRLEYDRGHATVVEDPTLLVDPEDHEEWYQQWLQSNPRRYWWPRLESFLAASLQARYPPEQAGRVVHSIDRASDAVLERMENPARNNFATKGLVVGYVQSGKTANFTAVIAKAVDAGYRLIVVLTGIHNNLRRQTQQRLDCELTGAPEAVNLRAVPLPNLAEDQWVRLTTSDHDFSPLLAGRFDHLLPYRRPVLAVMKKNTQVLRRFLNWASRARDADRGAVPLILIDDEADLASIDTNAGQPAGDPTATNRAIRDILRLFPRSAYIGYTATPFANVLINLDADDPELGRDLYPRNFIVSLPRPDNYFGSQRVFAGEGDQAYVRIIPDPEVLDLTTSNRRLVPQIPRGITASLGRAIRSFVLAGAARHQRGQGGSPMTMLIHTTMAQAGQARMKEVVDAEWRGLRGRWSDAHLRSSLRAELATLWDEDFRRTTRLLAAEFRCVDVSFEEIEPYIEQFLGEVNVLELNSATDDDLDYVAHPDLKALAIGGNKLSRGLTLEGLTVSLFLRASQEYDTLLQMGRWFGYREGYEDLTRVYTSSRLAGWFEDLALIESELRDEIYRYQDEGVTPKEMPVRIRAHQAMRVTARNKMGQGALSFAPFDGLRQTTWFQLDTPTDLEANLDLGERFVRELGIPFTKVREGHVARGVPVDAILEFLGRYRFADAAQTGGAGLDHKSLIAYIGRHRADTLATWNVGVPSLRVGTAQPFGGLPGGIVPVIRNRHTNTGPGYRIGVISDPNHIGMDGEPAPKDGRVHPLLLLYVISRHSRTREQSEHLVDLFHLLEKPVDVLGLVFALPLEQNRGYYQQPAPAV